MRKLSVFWSCSSAVSPISESKAVSYKIGRSEANPQGEFLFDSLEQFGSRHFESDGKSFKCAQADLFPAEFKITDIVLSNSGTFGQVDLTPTTLKT